MIVLWQMNCQRDVERFGKFPRADGACWEPSQKHTCTVPTSMDAMENAVEERDAPRLWWFMSAGSVNALEFIVFSVALETELYLIHTVIIHWFVISMLVNVPLWNHYRSLQSVCADVLKRQFTPKSEFSHHLLTLSCITYLYVQFIYIITRQKLQK